MFVFIMNVKLQERFLKKNVTLADGMITLSDKGANYLVDELKKYLVKWVPASFS
ncbi:Protein of unknown function [Bacillus cytotoxicus]|nr:Protein of unknown function [Bacillus cytotoxicus]